MRRSLITLKMLVAFVILIFLVPKSRAQQIQRESLIQKESMALSGLDKVLSFDKIYKKGVVNEAYELSIKVGKKHYKKQDEISFVINLSKAFAESKNLKSKKQVYANYHLLGNEGEPYSEGHVLNGIYYYFFDLVGCKAEDAMNFNPYATFDDGGDCIIEGCADRNACNFNRAATQDDGSCTYPKTPYHKCNGSCMHDTNKNKICDEEEIKGCLEEEALNFNADATLSDDSCEYGGCTDESKTNYDPRATIDDGSCIYVPKPPGYFEADYFIPIWHGGEETYVAIRENGTIATWGENRLITEVPLEVKAQKFKSIKECGRGNVIALSEGSELFSWGVSPPDVSSIKNVEYIEANSKGFVVVYVNGMYDLFDETGKKQKRKHENLKVRKVIMDDSGLFAALSQDSMLYIWSDGTLKNIGIGSGKEWAQGNIQYGYVSGNKYWRSYEYYKESFSHSREMYKKALRLPREMEFKNVENVFLVHRADVGGNFTREITSNSFAIKFINGETKSYGAVRHSYDNYNKEYKIEGPVRIDMARIGRRYRYLKGSYVCLSDGSFITHYKGLEEKCESLGPNYSHIYESQGRSGAEVFMIDFDGEIHGCNLSSNVTGFSNVKVKTDSEYREVINQTELTQATIIQLQNRLGIKETGEMDANTEVSLIKFQAKNKITADGQICNYTLEALNLSINDILLESGKNTETIQLIKSPAGTYEVPCKINELPLTFIFDTGASEVTLSAVEAEFMIRHGYLKESDKRGAQKYIVADGRIVEGTKINIRTLQIGEIILKNVEASISHSAKAPLLLGQSAISRLGTIQLDPATNVLTIIKSN